MDALTSAIKNELVKEIQELETTAAFTELVKEIQELETTAAFTESVNGEFIISNLIAMKLKTLVHVSFVSHLSPYND